MILRVLGLNEGTVDTLYLFKFIAQLLALGTMGAIENNLGACKMDLVLLINVIFGPQPAHF